MLDRILSRMLKTRTLLVFGLSEVEVLSLFPVEAEAELEAADAPEVSK